LLIYDCERINPKKSKLHSGKVPAARAREIRLNPVTIIVKLNGLIFSIA